MTWHTFLFQTHSLFGFYFFLPHSVTNAPPRPAPPADVCWLPHRSVSDQHAWYFRICVESFCISVSVYSRVSPPWCVSVWITTWRMIFCKEVKIHLKQNTNPSCVVKSDLPTFMRFLTSEYAATHRPSEILFSWIWLWNDWRLCGCVHLSDIRQLARSPAPCPTPYISNVSTSLLDERCVDATLTLSWRIFWVKSHTWQIIVTVAFSDELIKMAAALLHHFLQLFSDELSCFSFSKYTQFNPSWPWPGKRILKMKQ